LNKVANKAAHLVLATALLIPALGLGQQGAAPVDLNGLMQSASQSQQQGNYPAAARAYQQVLASRPDIAEVWADLGLMQHEEKQYAQAIQSFREAHRRNPSLYVPNLFLGIDLLQTGKATEAVTYLAAATRLNAKDVQGYLALGRAYAALGKPDQAAAEFRHVLNLNPQESPAWFSLGIAYLDEVESAARQMSSIHKQSPYAKALYAESLVKQVRYLEADDLYKGILATEQRPPCMHAELGFAYLKQHKAALAESEFEAEEHQQTPCSLARLGEVRLYIERGSDQDAVQRLKQLWARDHGFLRAHAAWLTDGLSGEHRAQFSTFLQEQHAQAGFDDELFDVLTAALQGTRQPAGTDSASGTLTAAAGQPEASYAAGRYGVCAAQAASGLKTRAEGTLHLLAACAFLTGDYDLSAKAAEAMLRQSSASAESLYWSIKANEQLAFQALDQYQQMEPNSERTHLLLGDMYRQRLLYDDAIREYRRALEIAPGDPAALLGLASAYLVDSNVPGAVDTIRMALKRAPDDPEMNLVLGEALVEQHQYAEAEACLKKALRAKPQTLPHVHALLGEVYSNTGRTAEAIQELKLGLSSDEDGSLHYQLARLYRQTGDTKDAAVALEQMKVLQKQRRESAVIAVWDTHPSTLDDGP